MPEVSTLDPASLESFITELIDAGFEPVAGSHRREWLGPAHESLAALTSTTQMRIEIRDGWPYIPPHVYARGLSADHVSARGIICLWRDDDPTRQWMALEGLHDRLKEWVEFTLNEAFRPGDLALDSHLGFDGHSRALATFQLWDLVGRYPADGAHGPFRAKEITSFHIKLVSSADDASIRGRWFYRKRLSYPPRTLAEFKAGLTGAQRRAFERDVERTEGPPRLDIVVLVWGRGPYHDVLPIRLLRDSDGIRTEALEPAPVDEETLRIRAGDDAKMMGSKHVAVIGVGAIGGHVALLLAQSGLGHLKVVDGDVLRPGNVVRHAGDMRYVGWPKVEVIRDLVAQCARWTKVEAIPESPHGPDALLRAMAGNDLVVDATGSVPMNEMVGIIAEQERVPVVSAALFRNGRVGRVRRHIPDVDPSLRRIHEDGLGTTIPRDANEEWTFEIGCSAPVNNAGPAAVSALSASTTRVSIDLLRGSLRYSSEFVEVYDPLDDTRFGSVGTLTPPS